LGVFYLDLATEALADLAGVFAAALLTEAAADFLALPSACFLPVFFSLAAFFVVDYFVAAASALGITAIEESGFDFSLFVRLVPANSFLSFDVDLAFLTGSSFGLGLSASR